MVAKIYLYNKYQLHFLEHSMSNENGADLIE